MTLPGKWSTLKDVNVKNQVQMHLMFDVYVFHCTPFPRERHWYKNQAKPLMKVNSMNSKASKSINFTADYII